MNFYTSVSGYKIYLFAESYLTCISYNYAVDSSNLMIFHKYIVRLCMYNTDVEFHILRDTLLRNHIFYIDKEAILSLFKGLKGGNFNPS